MFDKYFWNEYHYCVMFVCNNIVITVVNVDLFGNLKKGVDNQKCDIKDITQNQE